MTILNGGAHRLIRVMMLAIALVAAGVLFTREHTDVSASHTKILVSQSALTPAQESSVVLAKNGPAQTFYVWAQDVDNSDGASSFQTKFAFDETLISMTDLTAESVWISSTGRSASCFDYVGPRATAPVLDPGEAVAWCDTLSGPGSGPSCSNNHCNGVLAQFTIQPGDQLGTTVVDLTGSQLADMQLNPQVIPATVSSLNVTVARCADFDDDNLIRVADILYVVSQFGLSSGDPEFDPLADLDEDGNMRVADILITVGQFGVTCPAE